MAVKARTVAKARVGKGGRLVIPAAMRRRLRFEPGSELVLTEVGDHLEVENRDSVLLQIQADLQKYIKPGVSLVDELIAERREAAVRGE